MPITPGCPFYVVQLFDQEGYYSHVRAETREEVLESARVRTARLGNQIVAWSLPFLGHWDGRTPNITQP
jgi:hypothetical protein